TGRRSSSRRPSRLRRLQARLASRRLRGQSLFGANGAPREAVRPLAARSLRTWTLGGLCFSYSTGVGKKFRASGSTARVKGRLVEAIVAAMHAAPGVGVEQNVRL